MLIIVIISFLALAILIIYGGFVLDRHVYWKLMQKHTRETAVKLARRHGKAQAMHYLRGKPQTFAQAVNQQIAHSDFHKEFEEYHKLDAEIAGQAVAIWDEKGLDAAKLFRRAFQGEFKRKMALDMTDWADEVEKR